MALQLKPSSEILRKVEQLSGQHVEHCYQCGKCSAGCPVAAYSELSPRKIIRYIQLGQEERLFTEQGIWLCTTCHTCSLRCPRKIQVSEVIECLRWIAFSKGTFPKQKEIPILHRTFIGHVMVLDRAYEIGLGLLYNLWSRHWLNQMTVVPTLLRKGKLKLFPFISAKQQIRKIYARVKHLINKETNR